jgi:hypothetical protein
MTKNIVVCCDGTAGEYGLRKSNVVRLYAALSRDTRTQLAFYDPGVGTLTAPPRLGAPLRLLKAGLGLAFGYGLMKNVRDAYRFLMQTYQTGDRIFLFGFSRGAYAARTLAAVLHKCGLLSPHNDNLLPYVLKVYEHTPTGRVSNGFRKTFAQKVRVHFLGVWDTVSSIGWIYDPMTLPYTAQNPSIDVVRHAVSIHERRCFYRQNLWSTSPGQDVREVWFAGNHRDIGGSYPESESGLSQLCLKWMLDEARQHGLLLDEKKLAKLLPTRLPRDPEQPTVPDAGGPIHDSLQKATWWIPELMPRLYRDPRDGYRRKLRIPLGEWRHIPEDVAIHASVFRGAGKAAQNLPQRYAVEPEQEPEPTLPEQGPHTPGSGSPSPGSDKLVNETPQPGTRGRGTR